MILPGADAPIDMTIKPIITVGDMVGDYRFEAIPDGISVIPTARTARRCSSTPSVDGAVPVHATGRPRRTRRTTSTSPR